MILLLIILLAVIISLFILEFNRSHDDHYEGVAKVREINRRNWNASTERISLIAAIVSGVIIALVLGEIKPFGVLMVILIIFIIIYFTSAWLSSHWYKRTHDKLDDALVGFERYNF